MLNRGILAPNPKVMELKNFDKVKDLVHRIDRAINVLETIENSTEIQFFVNGHPSGFELERDIENYDNEEIARLVLKFYADIENAVMKDIDNMKDELELL